MSRLDTPALPPQERQGALDAHAGLALRQRRAHILLRLAAHRAESPLQPRRMVGSETRRPEVNAAMPRALPDWRGLPPAVQLGMAAAAGGVVVALRPWRLLRRAARWMAPVVSMELRARLWQHAKRTVGAVLRQAVETSDSTAPR